MQKTNVNKINGHCEDPPAGGDEAIFLTLQKTSKVVCGCDRRIASDSCVVFAMTGVQIYFLLVPLFYYIIFYYYLCSLNRNGISREVNGKQEGIVHFAGNHSILR